MAQADCCELPVKSRAFRRSQSVMADRARFVFQALASQPQPVFRAGYGGRQRRCSSDSFEVLKGDLGLLEVLECKPACHELRFNVVCTGLQAVIGCELVRKT